MYRGGGSAGGGKSKGKMEFLKVTPKFIQDFRLKLVEKENGILDKKDILLQKKENLQKKLEENDDNYDIENATIDNKNDENIESLLKKEEILKQKIKIRDKIKDNFKPTFIKNSERKTIIEDSKKQINDEINKRKINKQKIDLQVKKKIKTNLLSFDND